MGGGRRVLTAVSSTGSGGNMSERASEEAWVFVVDDDRHFLGALENLLSLKGYRVAAFTSPIAFLDRHDPGRPGCLLLDLQMSELSGLEVQAALTARGQSRPVVFLTGTDRVEEAVSAMKGGALNYLIKPAEPDAVLEAVDNAVQADAAYRKKRLEAAELLSQWRILSNREQEVFWYVARGRLNKQIAHDLNITEKTVKVHRSRMKEKLKLRSTAALVHLAARIQPLWS
ncbi:MAG TPA: response regulator [Rhizomicrobium sp.]|nr:response regulator [Rhizomicrobium sp.]